jgi:hypothetical protein
VRVRGCDVGYGADDWIELKGRTSPWVPVFEPRLDIQRFNPRGTYYQTYNQFQWKTLHICRSVWVFRTRADHTGNLDDMVIWHLTEFNCRSHIAFMCLTAEITWNEFDSELGISNLI